MRANEIECAVASRFDFRTNIIVPNVSWALFPMRELDMLILRPSGWAEEVEIKVTASDIKADLKKRHDHRSPLIHKTWFAVPKSLALHPLIPLHCGILAIDEDDRHFVETVRAATINKLARKLTAAEIQTLGRLAAMRIWSLKHTLRRQMVAKQVELKEVKEAKP